MAWHHCELPVAELIQARRLKQATRCSNSLPSHVSFQSSRFMANPCCKKLTMFGLGPEHALFCVVCHCALFLQLSSTTVLTAST